MSLTITYTGDLAALTLPGRVTAWIQSTRNSAAAVPMQYAGDPAALRAVLDTPAWGDDYVLTFTADPRPPGGHGVGARIENRLALEAERAAQARERMRAAGLPERAPTASISPRQYTRWRP